MTRKNNDVYTTARSRAATKYVAITQDGSERWSLHSVPDVCKVTVWSKVCSW